MRYFGSSTGVAASIIAATTLNPRLIKTIVLRGGRADFEKNSRIEIVKGATHLFEEQDALDKVSYISCEWIVKNGKD